MRSADADRSLFHESPSASNIQQLVLMKQPEGSWATCGVFKSLDGCRMQDYAQTAFRKQNIYLARYAENILTERRLAPCQGLKVLMS